MTRLLISYPLAFIFVTIDEELSSNSITLSWLPFALIFFSIRLGYNSVTFSFVWYMVTDIKSTIRILIPSMSMSFTVEPLSLIYFFFTPSLLTVASHLVGNEVTIICFSTRPEIFSKTLFLVIYEFSLVARTTFSINSPPTSILFVSSPISLVDRTIRSWNENTLSIKIIISVNFSFKSISVFELD